VHSKIHITKITVKTETKAIDTENPTVFKIAWSWNIEQIHELVYSIEVKGIGED
jgi:hypothetical protein